MQQIDSLLYVLGFDFPELDSRYEYATCPILRIGKTIEVNIIRSDNRILVFKQRRDKSYIRLMEEKLTPENIIKCVEYANNLKL